MYTYQIYSSASAMYIISTTFAYAYTDIVTVILCIRGCNCNSTSRLDDTSSETVLQGRVANVNSTPRTIHIVSLWGLKNHVAISFFRAVNCCN